MLLWSWFIRFLGWLLGWPTSSYGLIQPDQRPGFEGWCINCGKTFVRRAISMAEFSDEVMGEDCPDASFNQWPPGHHLTKIRDMQSGLTVNPFVHGLCRCSSRNGDHAPGCAWKNKAVAWTNA